MQSPLRALAVKRIDEAIKDLEKNQGSLTQVSEQFALANDLTIKRLTRGNPTMAAKFAELPVNTTD